MMNDVVGLLARRRSVLANEMTDPGPDDDQLRTLLTIAARVPDHGKLAPWRFIVFRGEARRDFGRHLEAAFRRLNPQADDDKAAFEANRFLRAPVVVAVVSRAAEHPKIPQWEQILSAGAACQNLLVAATGMGFASQWITEWYAYDPDIRQALGLADHERVAGFVYIGTATRPPSERARPDVDAITEFWSG